MMNLAFQVVCLVAVLGSFTAAEPTFQQWKEEYGKAAHFAQDNTHVDREEVYDENVKRIQGLNAEGNGATFAVNQFAAMTPEEFRQHVLMPQRSPVDFPEERYSKQTEFDFTIPESFDWRDRKPSIITSVKNQGALGICWAFSTIANLEGQWGLLNHTVESLSVEQLVDCDAEIDPHSMNADCGVFGGWPYLAYQYVEKAGGLDTDAVYKYCSSSGDCYPCVAKGYNVTRCGTSPPYCRKNDSCAAKIRPEKFVPGLEVTDWTAFTKNETALAGHLIETGPLSVVFNAELLNWYHGGVWHPPFCHNDTLDHAVLLVGYGVEHGKPYWTIKNSWGPKWGEEGYFKMARGVGACGVNLQVTSAVLRR